MKHFKLILVSVISILLAAYCIYRIIVINTALPNAEEIIYDKENIACINGVECIPVYYEVMSAKDFNEINNSYSWLKDNVKSKSKVVVITLKVRNTSDVTRRVRVDLFELLAEDLNTSNGINFLDSSRASVSVEPGHEEEVCFTALLTPSQLAEQKLQKLEDTEISLVYSYYPYRRKIVFEKKNEE